MPCFMNYTRPRSRWRPSV